MESKRQRRNVAAPNYRMLGGYIDEAKEASMEVVGEPQPHLAVSNVSEHGG